MKILITGAAGFFGSNLSEYFLDKGHQVIGVDNFNDFYSPKIKEYIIRDFKDNPNFTLYRVDILDQDKLAGIFKEHSDIDHIVHLAALAGVTASVDEPVEYLRNNTEGVINLAELAVEHKIKSFIFASTSAVYGTNEVPFKEDMPIFDPQSPYPATKRAAELLLKTYNLNFDLPVTIMRIFNPVAPRMRPDLALPMLIRSCEYGEEFPVYWSDPTATARDYCYAVHMFEAIESAMEKAYPFEIFNLGNSKPETLQALFDAVEKATGKKLNLKTMPERNGEMITTYADISKTKEMLGYDPSTPLEESVKIYYDWFMKQDDIYKKDKF